LVLNEQKQWDRGRWAFLQPKPNMATLNPPPSAPPYLLMQNLSPKDIARRGHHEAESLRMDTEPLI